MNPLRKKQEKPRFSVPENWKRRIPWIAGAALGVALLAYGGICWATWAKRHPAPPKEDAKRGEIAKYIVSDSFTKLSLSQKEDYLKKMMPQPGTDPRAAMQEIDENTRHALFERMREVREAQMKKTAREYFALPKEKREAWMANHIAEQDKRFAEMRARFQQMRQQRQQGGGTDANRQGGQRRGGGSDAGGPPPGPPPF